MGRSGSWLAAALFWLSGCGPGSEDRQGGGVPASRKEPGLEGELPSYWSPSRPPEGILAGEFTATGSPPQRFDLSTLPQCASGPLSAWREDSGYASSSSVDCPAHPVASGKPARVVIVRVHGDYTGNGNCLQLAPGTPFVLVIGEGQDTVSIMRRGAVQTYPVSFLSAPEQACLTRYVPNSDLQRFLDRVGYPARKQALENGDTSWETSTLRLGAENGNFTWFPAAAAHDIVQWYEPAPGCVPGAEPPVPAGPVTDWNPAADLNTVHSRCAWNVFSSTDRYQAPCDGRSTVNGQPLQAPELQQVNADLGPDGISFRPLSEEQAVGAGIRLCKLWGTAP
ncbi:MAG: hypothetical protein M3O22_04545 [Pseudomonadota bacterium]|nr:hypothetical protein [Pseudomonadota bacterium]